MNSPASSEFWKESTTQRFTGCNQSIAGMFCMDLDGTLLRSGRDLHQSDHKALQMIGNAGWIRVIATGRSMDSFKRVFPEPEVLPADYIIFSSGVGIFDVKTARIIRFVNLTPPALTQILAVLNSDGYDYMVHYPAPINTPFFWWSFGRNNPDFFRRISLYKHVSAPLPDPLKHWHLKSAQIIAVQPENKLKNDHDRLRQHLPDFTVVRTTSPLDGSSTWYEIYPEIVSKGKTCQWLKLRLCGPSIPTVAIGNDYNDLDMLEWADGGYVVNDAPDEMKQTFHVIPESEQSPVARLVSHFAAK